jgi:YggT family protein
MVLDAITEVTLFLQVFSGVYVLALVLYVLSSWIKVPYSLNPVLRFLSDICDPYLRLWRRLLPMSFGAIDFTPMISIFALIILTQIVVGVLDRIH